MDLVPNLLVVRDINRLPEVIDGRNVHATNGVYSYDPKIVVPTTLAGFQYVADNDGLSTHRDVFFLGVNSDVSMKKIMAEKGASAGETNAMESQIVRAMKVAMPLALEHPARNIVVGFFDDKTPNSLYEYLEQKNVWLRSLHKHGYGTTPDAPRIEGSERFEVTLGFPLPGDKAPVCFDITPRESQPHVNVVRLTEPNRLTGKKYLTDEGKLLFTNHDENYVFTQAYADSEKKPAAPSPKQPELSLADPGWTLRHE